jgi:hypothetical protein
MGGIIASAGIMYFFAVCIIEERPRIVVICGLLLIFSIVLAVAGIWLGLDRIDPLSMLVW